MKQKVKIAPSLLSADFVRLGEEIGRVERGGCDMLHIDVMDGHFVPNITIGPFVVEAIRRATALPLDVHLMIENPKDYVEPFARAGARWITAHAEACEDHLGSILRLIKDHGCLRGVSLKPKTPIEPILPFLKDIDMVLFMTVNPGFAGQVFMPEVLPKISRLRRLYAGDIEVDGGINADTAGKVVEAGANILVAGTAIFGQKDAARAIRLIRGSD